jgi:hypothetical protein
MASSEHNARTCSYSHLSSNILKRSQNCYELPAIHARRCGDVFKSVCFCVDRRSSGLGLMLVTTAKSDMRKETDEKQAQNMQAAHECSSKEYSMLSAR